MASFNNITLESEPKRNWIYITFTLLYQLIECAVVSAFGQFYHLPVPVDLHLLRGRPAAQVRDLFALISGFGVDWVEN